MLGLHSTSAAEAASGALLRILTSFPVNDAESVLPFTRRSRGSSSATLAGYSTELEKRLREAKASASFLKQTA